MTTPNDDQQPTHHVVNDDDAGDPVMDAFLDRHVAGMRAPQHQSDILAKAQAKAARAKVQRMPRWLIPTALSAAGLLIAAMLFVAEFNRASEPDNKSHVIVLSGASPSLQGDAIVGNGDSRATPENEQPTAPRDKETVTATLGDGKGTIVIRDGTDVTLLDRRADWKDVSGKDIAKSAPLLRRLTIVGEGVLSHRILEGLPETLHELNLSHEEFANDGIVPYVAKLSKLTHLTVSPSDLGRSAKRFTDEGLITILKACPDLEYLNIGIPDGAGFLKFDPFGGIGAKAFVAMAEHPKLSALFLDNRLLKDDDLRTLSKVSKLRSLRLSIPGADAEALATFGGLKELRSLTLTSGNSKGFMSAGGSYLEWITELSKLTMLSFKNLLIGAEELKVLSKLNDSLRGLTISAGTLHSGHAKSEIVKFTNLESLSLSENMPGIHRVTDEFVEALSTLKKLTKVDLRSSVITDVAFKHLAKMELRELSLRDCKGITEAALMECLDALHRNASATAPDRAGLTAIDLIGTNSGSRKLIEQMLGFVKRGSLRSARLNLMEGGLDDIILGFADMPAGSTLELFDEAVVRGKLPEESTSLQHGISDETNRKLAKLCAERGIAYSMTRIR